MCVLVCMCVCSVASHKSIAHAGNWALPGIQVVSKACVYVHACVCKKCAKSVQEVCKKERRWNSSDAQHT